MRRTTIAAALAAIALAGCSGGRPSSPADHVRQLETSFVAALIDEDFPAACRLTTNPPVCTRDLYGIVSVIGDRAFKERFTPYWKELIAHGHVAVRGNRAAFGPTPYGGRPNEFVKRDGRWLVNFSVTMITGIDHQGGGTRPGSGQADPGGEPGRGAARRAGPALESVAAEGATMLDAASHAAQDTSRLPRPESGELRLRAAAFPQGRYRDRSSPSPVRSVELALAASGVVGQPVGRKRVVVTSL